MAIRFESNSEPIPGYRLLERLGSGGFGEVWKCEAPGGIFKAVKIIHGDLRSKDNDLVRYAEQELKALKRVKAVRHPYLLALDRYDIVEGRLLIVMELADCNLWDRFRQCRLNGLAGINRDDLLMYMQEAAEVLDLMNFEHQLMHLDVKPQNIFLQYNHVKVGDFGQVKDLEGMMASVTGGITPVYAAPETFDGIVTRFCDQYSLACVYQELLTGQRPFDGTSMQQLLMQHLTAAPNLSPSPPPDQPILAKALSKKPEDRYPNCQDFVWALRSGALVTPPPVKMPAMPTSVTQPWKVKTRASSEVAITDTPGKTGSSVVTFATTGFNNTPLPEQLAEPEPPRTAPPLQSGPGPIRPALIIGLGATGLRFLQRFRKQVSDRFGSFDKIPSVRSLFIDTDPETIAAAMTDRAFEGLSPLKAEEIFAARLNRSTHYLKPRQTGRTLIEGWFDPQMLHRLPRNPLTQGVRAFGRLALCDHYRPLMQKIEADLETTLTPEAIQQSVQSTGLPIGSNRPRIYLAASLCGGTGSGMALDLAYILRNRLRRLGYSEADVVGLLFVPPDDPCADYPASVRINVVAALTEINHYSRPGSTFQSFYDDRHSYLRDPELPFSKLFVLPAPLVPVPPQTPLGAGLSARTTWANNRGGGLKAKDIVRASGPSGRSATIRQSAVGISESAAQRQNLRALEDSVIECSDSDPVMIAADWLRLDLFGNLGLVAEASRTMAPPTDAPTSACTWGLVRYEWPRSEIVARTARVISGVMLDQWVSPDPSRARDIIPIWTANLWQKLGLDFEGFVERLRKSADTAMSTDAERLLVQIGESVVPKSWLARTPDAAQVGHTLVQWQNYIGHPAGSTTRPETVIEDALRITASDLALAAQAELSAAVPRLIDDPAFRLAGAEEAARQLIADINRMASALNSQADELDAKSIKYYELLTAHAHGTSRVQAAALLEGLREYPHLRFLAVIARRAARTYFAFKEGLTLVKNDVANCRQRLLSFKTALLGENECFRIGPGSRQVMPFGCASIEEASKRYLDVLTDHDLQEMEACVQKGIEEAYGGLYEACLNTSEGASGLLAVLRDQTRGYLNQRLGNVDLAAMFEQKFGSPQSVVDAFRGAHEEARPALIEPGPWSRDAVTIFAAPFGETGDPLREAAEIAMPDESVVFADSPDETLFYREYPHVPLAALPHFGPAWQAAYASAFDTLGYSPHTRMDVAQWLSIDQD